MQIVPARKSANPKAGGLDASLPRQFRSQWSRLRDWAWRLNPWREFSFYRAGALSVHRESRPSSPTQKRVRRRTPRHTKMVANQRRRSTFSCRKNLSASSLWQKSWQAEARPTWCRKQLIHRGGAGAFACEPGGMGLLPQAVSAIFESGNWRVRFLFYVPDKTKRAKFH